MVDVLPMYRIYGHACRSKRYSMCVSDGMSGEKWGLVKAGRDTRLVMLPQGVELDLSETPNHMRGQFVGEFMADMTDNFL